MKAIVIPCLVMLAAGAFVTTSADAQIRGIAGIGLSAPVGDFADASHGAAKAGGINALIGGEWLPAGRNIGLRVDGAYNRFCTNSCDASGGSLDVKYQILNANLSGIMELPIAGQSVRPYLLAGAGVYTHKLHGADVPAAGSASETEFGVSGGLGLNLAVGQVGIFAEGRFHNVFTTGSDLQYIPVTVGVRFGGR